MCRAASRADMPIINSSTSRDVANLRRVEHTDRRTAMAAEGHDPFSRKAVQRFPDRAGG